MGLGEGPVSCKERRTLQVNEPVGPYPSVRVQLANRQSAAVLPRCLGHSDPCLDHGCRLRRAEQRGLGPAEPWRCVRGSTPGRPPSLLTAAQTVGVTVIADALGRAPRRLAPLSRWCPGERVQPSFSRMTMRQRSRQVIGVSPRIPEIAAAVMIAAVRTIPTKATASSRCSGRVHGSEFCPAAVGMWDASCPQGLSTPT